MPIFIAAGICVALMIGVYFLLLMADGRRLRDKMLDRRPAFVPRTEEEATPLITSDYASWMAPPIGEGRPAALGGRNPFFSTTPDLPGAD